VVVNAVMPRRFSADDVERIRSDAVPGPIVDAVRRQHGQGAAQQGQLARLRRHASAHVTTLPFLPTTALGVDDVHALARRF
jgi:hypothetical protein